MIRVGFVINFRASQWLGGYNYYKNLFNCLNEFENKKIIPIIITDKKKEIEDDEVISKLEIIETQLVSRSNLTLKIFNKVLIILFNKNIFLEKFYTKNNIQVLSHSGWIGKKSKIINLPWIPDFQELHLPENFNFTTRLIRRCRVFFCYYFSTKIIVSSKSVLKDLKRVSKNAAKNSLLIKHSVDIPRHSELKSLQYLKKKYQISYDYFFLPNHYWKHKNHKVVFKAMEENKNKKKYFIISTGNISDHRHPEHINDIKKYISKNVFYKALNIIPYIDMLSLMYYSIAVINPSKSEGWSNTVEQAKAMEKKIILSDIKVHLEQRDKNCIFFQADDYKKLNTILERELFKFKRNTLKKYDNKNNTAKKKFINTYQQSLIKLLS